MHRNVNLYKKIKIIYYSEFLVQKEERPFFRRDINHIILRFKINRYEVSLSKYFSVIDKIIKDEEFFSELAILCRDKSYAHFEWSHLAGRIRNDLYLKGQLRKLLKNLLNLWKPLLSEDYYNFVLLILKIREL